MYTQTDNEPRLVRVSSPGPELTLPDEFGAEWKNEKDLQATKEEETRTERRKVCLLCTHSVCDWLASILMYCT